MTNDKTSRNKTERKWSIVVITFFMLCVVGSMLIKIGLLSSSSGTGAVAANEHMIPASEEWNLIVVNRWNKIPEDYSVTLTELPNGQKVDSRIYPDLQEMVDAAREEGIYLIVGEGYRTAEEQQKIFDDKIQDYIAEGYTREMSEKLAEAWVAVPGTSEHQLGVAVDINADNSKSSNEEVYTWLAENAYSYGFILRYPLEKEYITGTAYEPWHYRYVGKEAAEEIYTDQLCLEEYIQISAVQTEKAPGTQGTDNSFENAMSTVISQGGPYGEISISLPDGWGYELCPIDSDNLMSGMYGIHFYPDDVSGGFIEIAYMDFFGVCGTGLAEESTTVAGQPANIGTYDYHEYWDFIAFQGEYKGMVAFTYSVDDWWSEYGDQVLEILDTLSYDQSAKEGGAYVYNDESWISEIELNFSLKNISSTGATLVFNQHNANAPKGELIYGEDFVIEVLKNGEWEEAPIPLEGNYGFNAIGIMLPCEEISEREIDWEWLYGELEPGEYRIGKSVLDSVESGNYDKYMVYAHFILN